MFQPSKNFVKFIDELRDLQTQCLHHPELTIPILLRVFPINAPNIYWEKIQSPYFNQNFSKLSLMSIKTQSFQLFDFSQIIIKKIIQNKWKSQPLPQKHIQKNHLAQTFNPLQRSSLERERIEAENTISLLFNLHQKLISMVHKFKSQLIQKYRPLLQKLGQQISSKQISTLHQYMQDLSYLEKNLNTLPLSIDEINDLKQHTQLLQSILSEKLLSTHIDIQSFSRQRFQLSGLMLRCWTYFERNAHLSKFCETLNLKKMISHCPIKDYIFNYHQLSLKMKNLHHKKKTVNHYFLNILREGEQLISEITHEALNLEEGLKNHCIKVYQMIQTTLEEIKNSPSISKRIPSSLHSWILKYQIIIPNILSTGSSKQISQLTLHLCQSLKQLFRYLMQYYKSLHITQNVSAHLKGILKDTILCSINLLNLNFHLK